jgi:hypothetical protein
MGVLSYDFAPAKSRKIWLAGPQASPNGTEGCHNTNDIMGLRKLLS